MSVNAFLKLFMMISRFTAQGLQRAELKLLYRAFRSTQLLRDLSNASLVNKAAHDHQALIGGQTVYQLKEHGPPLRVSGISRGGVRVVLHRRIGRHFNVLGGSLPPVGQRVGGNPQQPCGKRNAAPLEASDVPQRLVKDLGGHVLRRVSVIYAPRDEGIDAVKITFIELGKATRIMLGRLDQEPLVGYIC